VIQKELKQAHQLHRQKWKVDCVVGANQFFLWREFIQKPLLPLMPWDVVEIHAAVSQQGSRVTRYALEALLAFGVGFGVLGPARMNLSNVRPALANAAKMELFTRSASYLWCKWENSKLLAHQQKVDQLVGKSLRELFLHRPPVLQFSPLAQAQKRETLYFEPRSRTFVPSAVEGAIPVLQLEIDVTKPQLSVLERSVQPLKFALSDLEKMPISNITDEKFYNQVVRTRFDDYLAFLDHTMANWDLPEGNCFKDIVATSQVVMSSQPDLVPLALPKKVFLEIEKHFAWEFWLADATGAGSFVPHYDFVKNEEKREYVLTLHYRFVPTHNPQDVKHFCSVPLARVDAVTVEAFKEDLQSPMRKFNEFLVQLCFSSFGGCVTGLPGQGTHVLSEGLIAPRSLGFIGLYALLEKYPQAMLRYFHPLYTDDLRKSLMRDEYSKTLPYILPRRPQPTPSKDYLEVTQLLEAQKKQLRVSEKQHLDKYWTLFAIAKMLSNTETKQLNQSIEQDLGLLPPQKLDQLYNRFADDTPPNLERFNNALQAVPSKHLERLKNLQKNILILQQKVNACYKL